MADIDGIIDVIRRGVDGFATVSYTHLPRRQADANAEDCGGNSQYSAVIPG